MFCRSCFCGRRDSSKRFRHPLLNDSKQLKESERDELKPLIEKEALAYAVAMVDVEEIDTINILRASLKAMHLAVEMLSVTPSFLLIDGNYFTPYKEIPYRCFIRGDGTYAAIAAASILAKTSRDAYMRQLHGEYPNYAWHTNKGYGTEEHRHAIKIHGLCKYHRRSFNILAAQGTLFQNSTLPVSLPEETALNSTLSDTGPNFVTTS